MIININCAVPKKKKKGLFTRRYEEWRKLINIVGVIIQEMNTRFTDE